MPRIKELKISVYYNPKPIPPHLIGDWDAYVENAEQLGCAHGSSPLAALKALVEMLEVLEDDRL